jgi:hypothetical protein
VLARAAKVARALVSTAAEQALTIEAPSPAAWPQEPPKEMK